MGKGERCGPAAVLYTHPAWTFGGKQRSRDAVVDGPGPGKYGASNTFGTSGPVFGGSSSASRGAQPHGRMDNPGTAYLKPGKLSGEMKAPAYTFGNKYKDLGDANLAGPGDYNTLPGYNQTMRAHPATTWGPPSSKPRPRSAPRTYPVTERASPKTLKGPTFGIKHKDYSLTQSDAPGPLAYRPCDAPFCACKPCAAYQGTSLGLRPPLTYGATARIGRTLREHNTGPSPAEYHVECSTIGAATMKCSSAQSRGTRR